MDEQESIGARPQWEHYIEYIQADAYTVAKTREYQLVLKDDSMKAYYPGKRVPPYAVQAILPRINELGDQGWELVQMQPVRVGDNGDIRIGYGGTSWTNVYLCTFKRLKRSAGS